MNPNSHKKYWSGEKLGYTWWFYRGFNIFTPIGWVVGALGKRKNEYGKTCIRVRWGICAEFFTMDRLDCRHWIPEYNYVVSYTLLSLRVPQTLHSQISIQWQFQEGRVECIIKKWKKVGSQKIKMRFRIGLFLRSNFKQRLVQWTPKANGIIWNAEKIRKFDFPEYFACSIIFFLLRRFLGSSSQWLWTFCDCAHNS